MKDADSTINDGMTAEIKELNAWGMDEEYIPDGYDMKSLPKPTAQNMEILMDKINELVEAVNELRGAE